jgi:hypothetical protein
LVDNERSGCENLLSHSHLTEAEPVGFAVEERGDETFEPAQQARLPTTSWYVGMALVLRIS